jgi:recombination protein RecR
MFPKNLGQFIRLFSRLPGIGVKTSERLGFYILSQPKEFADSLSDAIHFLKEKAKLCSLCGNISEDDPCVLCTDTHRDQSVICVVENAMDIYSIEATHIYQGLYHVLGGVISPLDGIMPKDLKIESLLKRIQGSSIKEIIFATSPTTEGDTTALYIKEMLKGKNIRMTHLARGIPVGTALQYAGNTSLLQAIRSREEI